MDVFHKDQSAPLTDEQKEQIQAIKSVAGSLYEIIHNLQKTEGVAGEQVARFVLGKRKLEECVMWAVKAVTMPKE
jgi:hypothetical protein